MVTALADLFNVGVMKVKSQSMQLVGSIQLIIFRDMSKDRYGSRFGTPNGEFVVAKSDSVILSLVVLESRTAESLSVKTKKKNRSARPETTEIRPSSNEVRKRDTSKNKKENTGGKRYTNRYRF